MQTDYEDPELSIEVDADGYRVDHRSETEQSSQSKEVHEYPDRTEIRLRDEKEVRLEEVKSRETTRRATYDDMIALLDAQLEGLDEIQTSREVTIQDFNRVETTRETVTDGELKREIRTTDEKRKEEILEGPKDSKRVVTTVTETLVVQPSPGALSLHETESPLSQISDNTESSSSDQPRGIIINTDLGTEPLRGSFNFDVAPGEAKFGIQSEGFGEITPAKTEGDAVWISKQDKGSLRVPGDLKLAENTGSLHRIQHRAHRIEELIVEDVDTFYEDQTRPAKRHSGLLGVKKEKRGKSQSPSTTLEKRQKTEDIKDPVRMMIEVENVDHKPSPVRPAQPTGVSSSIAAVPRTDIVIQPGVHVDSGISDKPRDAIVDPYDRNTNRVTYVVTYDSPGGVNIHDSGKRKRDVHPKKKKDKRRLGKQQTDSDHVMPAETEFVTYVVNYDRTEPLDGDNRLPRPAGITKPESSFPEPSISKEPRAGGSATIEVDMNAGDVKVTEPVKVSEGRHDDSKTFVVNYEVPTVEKSAKPTKPNKEFQDAKKPSSSSRQSPNEEFTYIVNYDQPSVALPTSTETFVESPVVDADIEKKAPVYSITIVEPGPGVSTEKARKSPEKAVKKKDGGSKDAIEWTYIVNHDEPRHDSVDATDNLPRNDGVGDVWERPPKPTFEARVRGKEEIKAKPVKLKGAPGNTESLTYVVEYERGTEEKAKGGIPVPKLKKGSISDDVVEKMYTYIVNYDQPSSQHLKKEKKKKKEKKGKVGKAALMVKEPRHSQKSYDIEQPASELSFTVRHPYPEPITQPKKPTSELSIKERHAIPEPAFEIRERDQEFSITVDHPFPEPVKQPEERFEEFSVTVDHPFPEPVRQPKDQFEDYSITVDHPFPEPATQPEDHFEEFSISIDHPFPEPVTRPERFENFSITVDHPFLEPVAQPEEQFEEFSIVVDRELPEPVTRPEERFEEFSITVDHPVPEPVTQPEEQFEEFFFAADYPFPEPATQPEEESEEYSFAVDHEFPEPSAQPEEQFREFSIAIDHPIPEAHHEIKRPTMPPPKIPEPIPSKDSGESLTYVVTYDTPTVSGLQKPTKVNQKRKPLFFKGSKPPVNVEVATETSPDVAHTFTYIVNYDEPSIRHEYPKVPKPVKAETKVFRKGDVKAPKPEIETSAKISGPIQSEELSITVTQPVPASSVGTPVKTVIVPSESAEGITYIVHHDESFPVDLTVEKLKKVEKKAAALKIKKPTEKVPEVGVLPEESAMPLPSSSSGLTIVVEHPEPKAPLVTENISINPPSTANTLTYVVNYDQPIAKKEKLRKVKGKRAETPKVAVKTREPVVITPEVPKAPSVNESISFTVVHDQPERPQVRSAEVTDGQWKPDTSEAMSFIVNYDLPPRTEQDVELREIEVEAPASIEISPSTDNISLEMKDVRQLPPTPVEPQADISFNIERTYDIPTPAITVPAPTGESVTYIVQYEEPQAKAIDKEISGKGKANKKGKKNPPSGADIEVKGAPLSTTTYEVSVTTDQSKPAVSAEVPKRKPKVSTETTSPIVSMPKTTDKDVATEQVTFVVNYGPSLEVIRTPEVRDTTTIEVEAEDMPQIEPFEITEPEVELEEPSSRLTITVEEPWPEVSAEIEAPTPEIAFNLKEPVAPIITMPDVVFPKKEGAAETFTYIVNHEEPTSRISGKVKSDKKEKKISKGVKAGAGFEAKGPEVTAEIAEGVPLYEVTVKTEHLEPPFDAKKNKKKKPEVSVATPEAAIPITTLSEDYEMQAQTQPQSITFVVNYDDSEKAIPISKVKGTRDIKGKATVKPKVKPPKAQKGRILSGEGDSMTYVVTYDDAGKFAPPKIRESEVFMFEVQDIPEIKSPEIPQADVDIDEPSSVLTIAVEQPLPEISAEVKPPTPERKVKELSGVEQFTITVEQPLPEVSTEVKLPTPVVKIKKPGKAVVRPPSVEAAPTDTFNTFTYVVTHDEPTLKIASEAKPEKKEKKKGGFSLPTKKISKELKEPAIETEVESLTYVVTYDDSGKVSPHKIKEHTTIEFQVKDMPRIESPEIAEAEVKLEEPSSQLTIAIEHPLPDVGAEVKAPAPEIQFESSSEFVVKPPSVEIKKAGAAETITYIVNYEEAALKVAGEVKPDKKDKKKRAVVIPLKKASKDVKASVGAKATGPEVTTEIAECVPVFEVSVTTEHMEPSVDAKKKKEKLPKVTAAIPEAAISITKPFAEIAANEEMQAQSITYVVTYDDTEKVLPPPAKKKPAIVEVEPEDRTKIRIPEIPEATLEVEEPSSQLTITVEQPPPEITADVKPSIPEIKVKEPSTVEQLTITVNQPLPEISTTVKSPIPEVSLKTSKVVVGPPSVKPHKEGSTETVTYIVTHDDQTSKIPEHTEKKKQHKKKKILGKTHAVGSDGELNEPEVSNVKKEKEKPRPQARIKAKKPAIDVSTGEAITYVVTYDDLSKATPAIKIKSSEIPESEFKVEEPSSQLTITVEQPLPEGSAEVKAPTSQIKIKDQSEVEQFTITVEQPLPEISAEIKPPTMDINLREPSDVEQLTISVEQPLPEISTKVKSPIPEVSIKKPSAVVIGPPSVELSKEGTAETFTYIVTHDDRPSKVPEDDEQERKQKKKKIRFPGKYFGKTYKYKVSSENELKEPKASKVTKAKGKPKPEAKIKTKNPATDVSTSEAVTYVVTHDDLSLKRKATDIPEPELKVKEPSSQLTITVEQPLEDISAEVKPRTPKIKVREPSGVEQLTITVEQPIPEMSAEVKPPTPKIKLSGPSDIEELRITVEQPHPEISAEIKPPITDINLREPSEVEQLKISVEQPLPEISTKVKTPIPEVSVKKPSAIVIAQPSIELSKEGTAETFTYIVTHDDRPSKVPEDDEQERKQKKKIRFPVKHFGKTYKYKVSSKDELKEPKASKATKTKNKPKPEAKIKAKKPVTDVSTGEAITYVVTYDDLSKTVPATKIKSSEIPESEFKVKEPSSQLTITVEQPLPEISAEIKPPTPEIKLREPSEIEQLTITVEQPIAELSAEVKPSTPEINLRGPSDVEDMRITIEQPLPEISAEVKIPKTHINLREPSDVEQLTISVEQPLPEVSTKVKSPIPEVSVKKLSKVAIGPPSIELSKEGTAETFTYIVTHEDRPSKMPEVDAQERKQKKKKIRFPGKYFGKTYKYKVSSEDELKEPKASKVTKAKEKPKSQAQIKTMKPATDVSTSEAVTYVVTYDDQSKAVPTTKIKSPDILEPDLEVKEPSSQLTITVEQPLPDISAEVKPPSPKIKVRAPSEVEQLMITVEQPLPELSAEVKPPTPQIKIKEPSEVEQFTITVEQPLPEISAEIKPPTPEIKIREPSDAEQFTITVEQSFPEISAEVKPPTPKTKFRAPSEIAIKPPSVELPKPSTTETVTYVVNHEAPTLKVSGEVKPDKKKSKQAGVRIPDKKVKTELKAGASVSAKAPITEAKGEVPIYEVTALPVEPEVATIPGPKGDVILKDAAESVTFVVQHEELPPAKEPISAVGEKKRKDWIWRVKKPAESVDISTESQDKESVRIKPEVGISAKIGEPSLGISAEAEVPHKDISISTDKAKVTQDVSPLTSNPETHTYVVTYDVPQVTTAKGKRKLFPRKGKREVTAKPKKNKWTLFKKKEPKVVKPRVDVVLTPIKPTDAKAGETIRGDVDVSVPAAPKITLEPRETIAGDVSGTVELPAAPEFSVTVFREEAPSTKSVTAPQPELTIPEDGETEQEVGAPKPTDISQLRFDVEAKLPGRKEQVFAEKAFSSAKVADAGIEGTEPEVKDHRTVIAGGNGRRDENAEEETVVYIVNYEQPFGTLTKAKDGAKEAPGTLKPETEVEAERPPDVTNIRHSVNVQMPQLEQCILVPIRDESSPEDSFYGGTEEAPVPAWPPEDEPLFEEEEDASPDVRRKFETDAAAAAAVNEKQLPSHLVVVAVDFGTTFSGYAFSFSRDPGGSIHVMRKWEGGDPGAVDHKTPTILLLTPGGQFHSFGFTARDFYHDLSPKEAARWLYFEKFKMALHFNDELNTETKLAAANGQCVPAINVFTHALRFFRKHVLQEVSDQVSTEVLNEDIYWIITVPAIWTEEAKQFMRLAAYRAGIASPSNPDQLLISLEPEAASIYVRKQRLHQLVPEFPFQRRRSCRRSVTPEPTAVNQPIISSERKVLPTESGQLVRTSTSVTVSWPVVTTIPQTDITVGHQVDTAGTRYMVVDCGGGTVDITVHEIRSRDGTLRELHRATGGPYGSVAVDQEFEKLLVEIFGIDFIDVFKAKRPAGWVDLLMAFESRKRAANPYNTKPLNVSLPFSFIDYHKKYRNCPVEHAIRKYGNRDIRWSSQGMLRLQPDAMNRLFLPAMDKIKEAIGNVLNDSEVKGLRFLFLVGGFADSPMLQVAIRQEFGHLLRIIIPNDASISILKGAVCFGVDPSVITTRKSRMTYGVGVLNRFVHGQHPTSKLVLKDGEEWCTDVFDALVYADQSVAIGDTVLRRYTLVPGDADDVIVSKVVNIYSSERRDVKWVNERGVTRCGTLCLTDDEGRKPSVRGQDRKDREVQVRMTFGHTEIKVTAFEVGTRKSVRATIDFLNK